MAVVAWGQKRRLEHLDERGHQPRPSSMSSFLADVLGCCAERKAPSAHGDLSTLLRKSEPAIVDDETAAPGEALPAKSAEPAVVDDDETAAPDASPTAPAPALDKLRNAANTARRASSFDGFTRPPRQFSIECPQDKSILRFKVPARECDVRVGLRCPGCASTLKVRTFAVYGEDADTPIRYEATVEKCVPPKST